GRLFRKYVATLTVLVSAAVLTSALVQGYFAYRDYQEALLHLQQEKATAAASQIRRFIRDTENQLRWALPPPGLANGATLEPRRSDYQRLLRQAPAVTEVSYVDAAGKEQLRLSRSSMNITGGEADYSQEARFREATAGGTYF